MAALPEALAEVRELLLAPDLIRAVAGGQRRGGTPSVLRATLRPGDPQGGRPGAAGHRGRAAPHHGQPRPRRGAGGPGGRAAGRAVRQLARGDRATATLRCRPPRRARCMHRLGGPAAAPQPTAHDRAKEHLLDPGDPLFAVIGGDAAKRRQVDAFLRALDATLPDRAAAEPAARGRPGLRQRVPDLRRVPLPGRARARRPTGRRGRPRGPAASATPSWPQRLGWADRVSFVAGTIADAAVTRRRRGAGAARLRHGHRRRAGPGGALGRPLDPGRALLPQGPVARSCAQHPPGAVRRCSPSTASCASASPTCSPTRCARRCCARHGYAGGGGRVHRLRAHPAQRADPRPPHRPDRRRRRELSAPAGRVAGQTRAGDPARSGSRALAMLDRRCRRAGCPAAIGSPGQRGDEGGEPGSG